MKLNITHLAPYLPYGLKVQLSQKGIFNLDEEFPQPHNEICEITNILKCNNEWQVEISEVVGDDSFGLIDLDEIVPILLPMSSLYTEMEDGTVPIVELAKIHDTDFDDTEDVKVTPLTGWSTMGHVDYWNNDGIECRFGLFNSFQAGYINPTRHRFVSNQLSLFTYLFSHHFDVFSLIDKGLAIDKTKIK